MTASYVYVGCRTTRERDARGEGIGVFRASDDGTWTPVQLVRDVVNPSFLAFGTDRKVIYVVHGDTSDVSAFRIGDADGRLSLLNRRSTQGRNPVHLAVDPSGRRLVVANHVTSSLAVLPIEPDGSLGEVVQLLPVMGQVGPHRKEQPFPKPHQTVFDPSGRFVIVPDKGTDQVETYAFDGSVSDRALRHVESVRGREGAGPRHVVFGPAGDRAYVLNELDSTVTAHRFDVETGRLEPFQVLSSLPDTFTGDSRASEIAMTASGRFVYASNRGADNIAVFEVGAGSGRLTSKGWHDTGGRTPRFFSLDPSERFLYAANEDSDSILGFRVDAETGRLTPSGMVQQTGSPVCILFGDVPARSRYA